MGYLSLALHVLFTCSLIYIGVDSRALILSFGLYSPALLFLVPPVLPALAFEKSSNWFSGPLTYPTMWGFVLLFCASLLPCLHTYFWTARRHSRSPCVFPVPTLHCLSSERCFLFLDNDFWNQDLGTRCLGWILNTLYLPIISLPALIPKVHEHQTRTRSVLVTGCLH